MKRPLALAAGLAIGGLLVICGCGQAGPQGRPAVPIDGKIVFVRGGEASSLGECQGRIELQSVEQPDVLAFGEVQEDGTFHVATLEDGVAREGAIEGTHRVRLDLDDSAQHLVDPRFMSFETSGLVVKVPSEEPIEVKVWR
jgi:hypothetical protein